MSVVCFLIGHKFRTWIITEMIGSRTFTETRRQCERCGAANFIPDMKNIPPPPSRAKYEYERMHRLLIAAEDNIVDHDNKMEEYCLGAVKEQIDTYLKK